MVFFLIIPGYNMDSKCDAFSFLSFFIFPSFFKPPAAGSPCCGRFAFDRELPVVSFRGAKRRGNLREMLHRHSGLLKNQSSPKFWREGSCKRKPSGFPFASNHPPQRQNCKIMIQKLILQFGKQLGEKAQRDFFDKLRSPVFDGRFVRAAD